MARLCCRGPVVTAARSVPRSRALTLLAWLLCALLGPGPALPALHFAVVAHRVCLEHGELEHVGVDAAVSGAVASAVVRAPPATSEAGTDSGKAAAPGRGNVDGHGHEACGVAGAAGHVAVLPPERAGVAGLELSCSAACSGAERAHHGIALLSYAPKLAPPARA
jgi:hypothetical protein